MKYLKIRIRRGDSKKGEHQMVYPDIYDAMEVEQVKVGPILYPNEIGKGASEEDCLICFSDNTTADEYIAQGDGDIIQLTEAEVDEYMNTRWERRNDGEEQVLNPERLLAIQVKLQAGVALSGEDQDVLNPDKRVSGINKINKDHNIFFHRFKVDNAPQKKK
jgi:hypothetical protein